jgi:hypothetical protein
MMQTKGGLEKRFGPNKYKLLKAASLRARQ